MSWKNPVPFNLVASADGESFKTMKAGDTALPLPPHPGGFGVRRANHVHEGVDLYCPDGTPVSAAEEGVVVGVLPFTGPKAGSDWWLDTDAVMVEGASGVIVYGEVTSAVRVGDKIERGQLIGHIKQVLKEDKGRPMSMLHLELHEPGTRDVYEWTLEGEKPPSLLDPTPFLRRSR